MKEPDISKVRVRPRTTKNTNTPHLFEACFVECPFETQTEARQTLAKASQKKESTMKVRSSIKRRTRDCQIVVRKGKRLVINKKNPRLKQRQG